jgi:hypothetical protein
VAARVAVGLGVAYFCALLAVGAYAYSIERAHDAHDTQGSAVACRIAAYPYS